MADFGVFAKFARTRLWGTFGAAVCVRLFSDDCTLGRILTKRSLDLRRRVFGAASFGPLFKRFSLGLPFEEFQKMADFGVFAKFARTRLCGHLWSRSLRQNVLRWLHFKRTLIKRSPALHRNVFRGAKFGPLFKRFSLGPPFEQF